MSLGADCSSFQDSSAVRSATRRAL